MTRESLLALLTLLGLALQLESLAAGGHAMSFIIKTTAFLEGETIPTKYTCDGVDVSPGLTWTGAPEGMQSLSLIADDPDAPVGTWTIGLSGTFHRRRRHCPRVFPRTTPSRMELAKGTTTSSGSAMADRVRLRASHIATSSGCTQWTASSM